MPNSIGNALKRRETVAGGFQEGKCTINGWLEGAVEGAWR